MEIKLNSIHIESGEVYPDDYDENDNEIFNTLDPEEIVLQPNKEYILEISYPLTNKAKFKISSGKKGVSRETFVKKVISFYKKIYEIEDRTTKTKPAHIPNMLNRNITNGMFGIWGHDIGDLVLVNAEVKGNKITLGVDS